MTTMGILVIVLGTYDLEALGVLMGPSSFALHITATLIVVGASSTIAQLSFEFTKGWNA
jgi:hypothetical protein